jgi:predicted P-loop ATPase
LKLAPRKLQNLEGVMQNLNLSDGPGSVKATLTYPSPCPHCGKNNANKWCYEVGELSVCKRGAEPASGYIKTNKTDKDGTPYYAPEQTKKARPTGINEYIYTDKNGEPLIKVVVVRPGRGNREKDVYQEYWGGVCWVKAKDFPSEQKEDYQKRVAVYRYIDCLKALSDNHDIFWVEGEGVCDALWELRIPSTTTIGGSGKYRAYGNHSACFTSDRIVLCPDRDQPGLKHMEEIALDFPEADWLYAPPSDFYWSHLPKNGGLDLKDWILDGATVDQIFEAVEERRVAVNNLNSNFKAPDGTPASTARSENKKLLNFIDAQWGETLRFNEMSLKPELENEPLKLDELSMGFADDFDIDVSGERAAAAVVHLAKKKSYHPVRDYLETVAQKYPDTPESRENLKTLAKRHLGSTEYLHDIFLEKHLIGAVGRVFDPGSKHDATVVLQGPQGLGKSKFWETLAVSTSWFDDTLSSSNSGDKDERMKLRAFWFLELAEIEALFKRKEVAVFRGFLTTRKDNIRLPYARTIEEFPRTSVFVGSVNPDEFLVDPEGHRRFWVVPTSTDYIDTDALKLERDDLWAAAVHAYRRGEKNYLSREEEKRNALLNKRFEVTDSWQEVIEFYLDACSETSISTILNDCLKIEIGRHDRQSQMRVAAILKNLGWIKGDKKKRIKGISTFAWSKPILTTQENNQGCQRKTERCQQGINEVSTEVSTPLNPYTVSISEETLTPFKENQKNLTSTQNNSEINTDTHPTPEEETGVNEEVEEMSETLVIHDFKPVDTSVDTSTNSENEPARCREQRAKAVSPEPHYSSPNQEIIDSTTINPDIIAVEVESNKPSQQTILNNCGISRMRRSKHGNQIVLQLVSIAMRR